MLYDRLYKAQRSNLSPAPKFPFPSVNVSPLQPVSKLTPSEPKPSSNPATMRLTSEANNPYNTALGQPGPSVSQPGFVNRQVPTNPPITQPMYNPMAYQGGLYNPASVVSSAPPQVSPPSQPVMDQYNTDTAATWNDPPALKTRKVSASLHSY